MTDLGQSINHIKPLLSSCLQNLCFLTFIWQRGAAAQLLRPQGTPMCFTETVNQKCLIRISGSFFYSMSFFPSFPKFMLVVDCVWNVMAHPQKSHFIFRRNRRVHLNRRRHHFSRLLAAEVCASAVAMLDTPCSEVVWRVLATHCIRQFPLHFPSRASLCAITFQLDPTDTPINWSSKPRFSWRCLQISTDLVSFFPQFPRFLQILFLSRIQSVVQNQFMCLQFACCACKKSLQQNFIWIYDAPSCSISTWCKRCTETHHVPVIFPSWLKIMCQLQMLTTLWEKGCTASCHSVSHGPHSQYNTRQWPQWYGSNKQRTL